jgi:hypothetical protein
MRSDIIYSLCDTILVGCKVYTDRLGKRLATAGKYSDGTNCFTVNNLGVVTAAELCGATTTTTSTTSTTTTSTTSTTTTSTTTTSTTSTTTTTTTQPPVEQAKLIWNFIESNGGQAQFDLLINDVIVETRFSTSMGNELLVNDGDAISVIIDMNQCSTFPNTYANAYTLGIINEASCVQNGPTSLVTFPYYVASGDIGSDILLSAYAQCASGCV